ncbi:MAG: glucose-1-phosphate cytidylyltransferase [Nanoarchaeota archaeon]
MEQKPRVVILCGGKGTRLQEETEYRPKPLVAVGGMPILWHIMKIYSHYGYNDFVLCLGYKGDMIKQYFLNYQFNVHDFTLNMKDKTKTVHHNDDVPDWNITFANTGLESNTGSRIKQIEKYIDADNFFLTYGDGVADVNIPELIQFHKRHNKIGTVTSVRPSTRFGNLTIQDDGSILDFTKTTKLHDGWIDGGFFVFKKEMFDYLSTDKNCMLESDPLKSLAKDKQFMSYKHPGFWQCMDTQRELEVLNGMWNSGNPAWRIWK